LALATTCPQCNTSFKVVPDQLKLRRGMVRCGVCQHVFSGIDYLRYVDDLARATEAARRATGAPAGVPDAGSHGAPTPADDHRVPAGRGDGARGPADRVARDTSRPGIGHDAGTPGRGQGAGADPFAPDTQDDLKTAFFLPETVFQATTQIVSGEPSVSEPTALPASIQSRAPEAAAPVSFEIDLDAPLDAGIGAASPAAPGTASTEPTPPAPASESPFTEHEAPEPDALSEVLAATRTQSLVEARPDPIAEPVAATSFDELVGGDTARGSPRGRGEAPASRATAEAASHEPVAVAGAAASVGTIGDETDAIAYFSAEERARGFTSRLRPLGWLAAAGLVVLLGLQLAIVARHALVEQMPGLRPALAQIVEPLGLSIEAPRDLQALTIESFELQAGRTPGVLAMSAVLRNRAGHGVSWPAMELTLTDGVGTMLVRKVILPADYLRVAGATDATAPGEGLRPHAELPIRLALEARDLAPAGYSVTLFYP
jgi:predicted Zn finger-like uncharacterized protein